MRRFKTLGSALLVAAVLVMGTDYVSFAATGQFLILGQLNRADAVTTLERTTNGAALRLITNNKAAAPFTTNGRGKVDNLNADEVDGHSVRCPAGTFRTRGVCLEKNPRAATDWKTASDRCAVLGRRLPDADLLRGSREVIPNGTFEWTSDAAGPGDSIAENSLSFVYVNNQGYYEAAWDSVPFPFRCYAGMIR